jgi:hypothetical protein
VKTALLHKIGFIAVDILTRYALVAATSECWSVLSLLHTFFGRTGFEVIE